MRRHLNTKLQGLFVALALLLPALAHAQWEFEWINGALFVKRYTGSGNAVIPSEYYGAPVVGIGFAAFQNCHGLTSVIIPNSVTNIGLSAFSGCSDLTSITIPNSVISIEPYAFTDCHALTSVTIPNSVTDLGVGAFVNCYSLTSVNIGNSVTQILPLAFMNCTNLTSVTIPDSVIRLGSDAFMNCYSLISVNIGNSVTGIEGAAFQNCSNLTSVTIPNSVIRIHTEAFKNCSGLTNVIIGNNVTDIGNRAFENCHSLTSVTIPNSVIRIWGEAFFRCSGLTNVIIGNSVTNIGFHAFWECINLTSLTIPNSVIGIESRVFWNCHRLTNIVVATDNPVYSSVDGVVFDKAHSTLIQFSPGKGGSYTIPDSVTSIWHRAFENCPNLTSVTVPNSVATIGDWAYASCRNVTNITFQGNAPALVGGFVFTDVAPAAKVYYYYGTSGWGATYGGLPTVMLAPIVFTAPLLPAESRQLEGTPLLRFQAFASGREPIQFRWYKDGLPLVAGPRISGVDYFMLTLRDLLPEDEGNYHVVASNADGSTNSSPVHLTIVKKPRITRQPTGGTREVGQTMNFKVEATGSELMTYLWHKGIVPLISLPDGQFSGINTPNLDIRWLYSNDGGDYWVKVCNEAGCTNSDPASLTVLYTVFGPGFLSAPVSRTNIVGTLATFSAEVWGSFPITNQWRRNGQNLGSPIVIPDEASNPLILTLPNVQPADAGDYDLVVRNPAGSVTSLPATLTVVTNPIITGQPQSQTIIAGTSTNFTVSAIGPGSLAYQWRKGGSPLNNGGRIAGASSATLTLTGVETGDAGGYDVIVANSYGSATSAVATLAIAAAPVIISQPQSRTNVERTTAFFTVGATGTVPLSYQWRKGGSPLSNGGNISGADTAALVLTGVVESDQGSYSVIVFNPFGTNTSASASLTVQLAPPGAPSGLTAVSSLSTRVTLNWTDNSANETSFRIERSQNGVNFTEISSVGANATSFTDTTVQPGTRYHYRVRTANGSIFSTFSNVAEVTTQSAGLSILPETLPVDWILARPDATYATSEIVPVTGQPFATALRVATLRKPGNLWDVQLFVATTAAVASNDLLKATFYLRQVQAQPGGEAQAAFLFQRASSPWESSVHHLGAEHLGEWRRYEVLFRARDNYPTGAAQGAFHLGHDTQIIEIGGVTVEHYAHDSSIPPSLLPDILPHGWNFHRANAGSALSQIVPVTGQPFTNAIRVTTLQRPEFPHQVQLNMPTVAGVATGNPILATFYLRRAGPSGSANARFVFEQSSPPWTGSANLPFGEAAGSWQRHQVVFNAAANHGAGQAQVNFQLGLDPQSIEIGGVSVAIIMAPFITAQPLPAAAIAGGTASFTVTAVAVAPLHYQWRKGGVPLNNGGVISGATSPTLLLTGITAEHAFSYDVVITNLHGAATSAPVALTIESVPVITGHPQATNATAGDTARFTVTASGTAPLSYRWRKNGTPLANGGKISGADSPVLQVSDVHLAEVGDYDVVVSNKWDVATSQAAALTVDIPPTVGVIEVGNPEDGVSLVLNGNPGECSLVLRSPNPSGPWEIVATIVYGPDGTASFLDGNPPADQAFYRTEALPSGPPQIQTHPVSVEAMSGSSLGFTVSVASCSLPLYQWQKNGVNLSETPRITGTQTTRLWIADARFSDAGDYDVVVVNGSGSSTSQVAVLTVVGRPVISIQPASVTNVAGTTAALSVTVEGPLPLAYQWRKGGVNLNDGGRISGSQGAELSLADTQSDDAGDYDVVVANAYGAVTSQVAVLTIVERPDISLQPASRTNLMGTLAAFGVSATGTGPLAYQWRKGGVELNDGGRIAGAQTVALSVTEVQSGDAGDYEVLVSNPYGSITSQVAVLVVVTRPSIVVQPVSQTNVAGATAHFSIGVAGTAPFGYQWRKGGTNLAESLNLVGAFSPTLAISNLVADNAGEFDVVVTNSYGSVTSAVAVLTLSAAVPVVSFLEWYRADSSQFDGLSDGDAIVNWLPEAGSSAIPGIVQAPGHEIVYRRSVAGLNGMPALEFRGGASIITDIANVNFNGVSVFLVFRNIGSGGVQRALAGQTSNTLLGPWHPNAGGVYNPVIHLNNVWKIHPADVIGWVDPSPCVLSVVIDDVSTEKSFINGVEINSTVGPGPMDTTGIGKLNFGHQIERYRGYISEFILYKRVLSAVEIDEVHDYLLRKYGLRQ